MAPDPRAAMCERVVHEMTAGSLQSVEALREVCNIFGLDAEMVVRRRLSPLEDALQARNEIVHEMDVDLALKTRSRRVRSVEETRAYVDTLLSTAEDFLRVADERLLKVREDREKRRQLIRRKLRGESS